MKNSAFILATNYFIRGAINLDNDPLQLESKCSNRCAILL